MGHHLSINIVPQLWQCEAARDKGLEGVVEAEDAPAAFAEANRPMS
jgi:hypothetical protein